LLENSYLIPEKSNAVSVDLLVDLATSGYTGYLITEWILIQLKALSHQQNIHIYHLGQDRGQGYDTITDLKMLLQKIKDICEKRKKQ